MSKMQAIPLTGMQQMMMGILLVITGVFFTGVANAADPVPYRGSYTGSVGIGEPRDVMRFRDQRASVPAAGAVLQRDEVIVTTSPKAKEHVAKKQKPAAKSALQICKDELTAAKEEAAKAAEGLKSSEGKLKAAEGKAAQAAKNLERVNVDLRAANAAIDSSFNWKTALVAGIVLVLIALLIGMAIGRRRKKNGL